MRRFLLLHDVSAEFLQRIKDVQYGKSVICKGCRMSKVTNFKYILTEFSISIVAEPFGGNMNDIFHHEDTYCAISSLVHTMPWEIKAAHRDSPMFDQIMDNVKFVCSEHFKISLSIADVHTVVRVLNKTSNNRYKQYQVGKLHLVYCKKDNPLKGSKGRYSAPNMISWQLGDLLKVDDDSAYVLQVCFLF
uniref:Uncharacterized protein n=1 Tax=Corethron hystrix TaxID=216773 RepID=A0A7S1BAH1_9STRA|mmetsp:Transcript_18715/g.42737  ORF Transcript_18715/g.42737 Transcript_18715/m.42737 type:complete len:190 (+) Transcript_18715:256-825(+)